MLQVSWAAEFSSDVKVFSSKKPGFNILVNIEYEFLIEYPTYLEFRELTYDDPVTVYGIVFTDSSDPSFYYEVAAWEQSNFELNTFGNDYLNYMILYEKDVCENSIVRRGTGCSNYQLENAQILQINGMDAYQLKHSYLNIPPQQSGTYTTKIVTDFKTPEYAWTIFAGVDTNNFQKYEKDFEAMTNSFMLKALASSQSEGQKTFSQSEVDEIFRLNELGSEKLDLGLYNEAIIYFDEALLINPNEPGVLNNKGVALSGLKKYPEALEYYQKALAIVPNYELYLKNEEITLKKIQKQESSACLPGRILIEGECVRKEKSGESGGGCLIATATFDSELAPQVQRLRELRDNILLQTSSGSAFMSGFNQFYYSFSPIIADWERQNLFFKEAVKLAITPLITSLSILNYVNMDSENQILGYGIGMILLNIGMYFVIPTITIMRIKRLFD